MNIYNIIIGASKNTKGMLFMKIKKVISCVFFAILLASFIQIYCFATNPKTDLQDQKDLIFQVYTNKYPGKDNLIRNIINIVTGSEQFVSIYDQDESEALNILEDSIRDAMEDCVDEFQLYSTRAGNTSTGEFYSPQTVPVLVQPNDYSCGPTALMQAIKGNGLNTEKELSDMIDEIKPDKKDGTNITVLCNYINNNFYSSSRYKYKVKAFTIYTYDKAAMYVRNSLYMDACPIYRISDTCHFDYYNNKHYTHYVTISYYNGAQNLMNFVDPNNNKQYRGTHTVTLDEFEESVSDDGWLLVMTKNTSDDPYIYN